MRSEAFDYSPLFPADLPPPVVRWAGTARHNFTGGHDDPDTVLAEVCRSEFGIPARGANVQKRA